MKKIYVSCATIPNRVYDGTLNNFIKSINNQTLEVEKIIINYCYNYTKYGLFVPPKNTEKVIWVGHNFDSPIIKYLGCVQCKFIEDTDLIITLDDDQEYRSDLVQNMFNSIVDNDSFIQNCYDEMKEGDGGLIHGFTGNMTTKKILRKLNNFEKPNNIWVDDQLVSIFCFKQDIPIYSSDIKNYKQTFQVLEDNHEKTNKINALHMRTNRDNEIVKLEKFYNVKFTNLDNKKYGGTIINKNKEYDFIHSFHNINPYKDYKLWVWSTKDIKRHNEEFNNIVKSNYHALKILYLYGGIFIFKDIKDRFINFDTVPSNSVIKLGNEIIGFKYDKRNHKIRDAVIIKETEYFNKFFEDYKLFEKIINGDLTNKIPEDIRQVKNPNENLMSNVTKYFNPEYNLDSSKIISPKNFIKSYKHKEKYFFPTNHFNGTILNLGKFYLFCYRTDQKPYMLYSKIFGVLLNKKYEVVSNNVELDLVNDHENFLYEYKKKDNINCHLEDPRLYFKNNDVKLVYTDGFKIYDNELKINIEYTLKGIKLQINCDCYCISNKFNKIEKNWVPLIKNDKTFFIYGIVQDKIYKDKKSLKVLQFERDILKNKIVSDFNLDWDYGEIKGGTPAIYNKDYEGYITFFHSSINYTHHLNRLYFAGAILLDNKPPFKPLKISKLLFMGDEVSYQIPRGNKKISVVFPTSFEEVDDKFRVYFGYQDYETRYIDININSLFA